MTAIAIHENLLSSLTLFVFNIICLFLSCLDPGWTAATTISTAACSSAPTDPRMQINLLSAGQHSTGAWRSQGEASSIWAYCLHPGQAATKTLKVLQVLGDCLSSEKWDEIQVGPWVIIPLTDPCYRHRDACLSHKTIYLLLIKDFWSFSLSLLWYLFICLFVYYQKGRYAERRRDLSHLLI